MKDFGLERVLEPVGAIPPTAWKVDNDGKVGEKELKVALDTIKFERGGFNHLCSACHYDETRIKQEILAIINSRGKLHNPYTETGGLICGTITEIDKNCRAEDFQVGDRVVTLTSMAGCPMHIDYIEDIDYNYGEIRCSGYAILFESTRIELVPEDVELKPFLFALEEEGSLIDVKEVLAEKKPSRVAVIGSSFFETMLYIYMASHYTDKEVRVIAIIDSNMTSNLSEASFEQVFKGIVDKLYFVDMGSSITAFSKIVEGEDNELMDAIINIGDVKGSETLASLLVKNKGFIFHTGMKSGYYQSIIATDCLGKEVTTYALDGYADGSYEFAIEMVKKLKENIKDAEAVLSKIPKNELRQKITKTVTDNMEVKEVDGFIFMSPITEEVVDTAINIAAYDCNVIIQGETGVGKEKILNLIHKHSPRRDKPCIRVNCATIQENLAESEFFGYEKGSFTGAAASGKIGYFELANNGTLFLDEIGSLPLSMQSKLLRVLQENSYYRVGGTEEKHTNVRVICANNIPLKQLVDEGKFREDLYYRLNICLIDVPPLRKRKEDVYCLADFFIKNYSKKYGVEKCFSYEALRRLSNYQWPGNVRELENAVHRLYITEKNTVIEESDVDRFLDDSIYDDLIVDIKKAVTSDENMDFSRIMDEQEKRLISYALEKEKTTRKAAEFLKIPQATFARKKLKHNL